ncbi:DnaJ domain-containing protein [Fulvivirgaceae bacterium BMA10]|uniref:DnaJ domain-containing protein n=1 Tax=Splendidivirga corallicola TaxID=3051826 RepID=A0ABT8KMN5_9BACT|nr:DnaJ domain-containing protein [Fulvivirgaceae bacterium BMA10]
MKDYYKILEIRSGASHDEVKKAYRRLAVRYHPDKNKYEGANALFNEINEAYQVLGDAKKRAAYDESIVALSAFVYSQYRTSYTYRRNGNIRADKKAQAKQRIKPYLRYFYIISKVGLIFGLLLFADASLPMNSQEESLEQMIKEQDLAKAYERYKLNGVSSSAILRTKEGSKMEIDKGDLLAFITSPKILVYRSAIFSEFMKVETFHDPPRVAGAYYNIHGFFIFLPALLVITSVIGIFYHRSPEFDLNVTLVSCMLMLIITVVMFMS